jgi:uncharacterized protein (DUF2141 family)
MKLFRIVIPTVVLLFLMASADLAETTLVIQFLNIRGEGGNILISMYDAPDQFPYQPKWKYMIPKSRLLEQGNRFHIKEVKSGKYAIAIFDDENCDTIMQKNFLGIPKEGYGFSNNPKPSIKGAPAFEECTFAVNDGAQNIVEIELQYLFRKPDEEIH